MHDDEPYFPPGHTVHKAAPDSAALPALQLQQQRGHPTDAMRYSYSPETTGGSIIAGRRRRRCATLHYNTSYCRKPVKRVVCTDLRGLCSIVLIRHVCVSECTISAPSTCKIAIIQVCCRSFSARQQRFLTRVLVDVAFKHIGSASVPHMNVRKNLSYPLVSQGMRRTDVKAKVAEVVDILGIHSILHKPVGGLSGGDRQRVALGRQLPPA